MKVFVCEYITGGGLYREELSASLIREATLMRDAVLADLNQLTGISTICAYDSRLPKPENANRAVRIIGNDAWSKWQQCIAEADAVLPIAPETNDALLTLTQTIVAQGKILLGCGADGIALASSKFATSQVLQVAGVKVVHTFQAAEYRSEWMGKCVAKPDDGVGCEGTLLFDSKENFSSWLEEADIGSYVVQPFLEGEPASISMLCDKGQAWLLSCNLQKISINSGTFYYRGSVLNGVVGHWSAMEQLAQSIAQAIPSLTGYIGVDVMIHEDVITVLEINPRLTTSYAGLHEALGCNPAGLLLGLLHKAPYAPEEFRMPVNIQRNEVDVCLDE